MYTEEFCNCRLLRGRVAEAGDNDESEAEREEAEAAEREKERAENWETAGTAPTRSNAIGTDWLLD